MKLKTTFLIVCISGIMSFCTACNGLPEASGDDDPEALPQETAALFDPKELEGEELNYYENLVKAQRLSLGARDVLMRHFEYKGYSENYVYCYIGEDYMLHVQLSEVTNEAKKALNTVFGDFAKAVVYEPCETPIKELRDYIEIMDYGGSKILVRHQEFFYSSGQ